MEATSSLSSSTHKFSQQISSFVNSPRLLTCLSSKASMDSESVMSPTSILDTKTFSTISHPFWSETNLKSSEFVNEIRHPCEKRDARGIIDALNDEKISSKSSDTRMVLFGSQLKIQIPPFQTSIISPTRCSKSSDELGIDPPTSGHEMKNSRRIFTRSLSASEMELSEDYTCVILHGPNPKMTHIFNNCIVESCSIKIPSKDSCLLPSKHGFPLNDFLSFCHHCKKKLDDGKDIFMYRGDKAFCSHECRHQEILLDEETEKKD